MDDGRKGSDANVRVEAYFHGPGFWENKFKQKDNKGEQRFCASTGKKPNGTSLI